MEKQTSGVSSVIRSYLFLEEGAAVVVEDGREVLAVRRRSQAVVQGQRDRGQFVPELIILLTVEQKNEALYLILMDVVFVAGVMGTLGVCLAAPLYSLSGRWCESDTHVSVCDPGVGASCAEAPGCPGRELS